MFKQWGVMIMDSARIKLLQQMPIFGGIQTDVLEFILSLSASVSVKSDEAFFRENDTGSTFFVLESGLVAVTKLWKGQQHVLRQLEVGDCFGEMAIMDLQARSASVIAMQDSSAIEIPVSCLYQVQKKDLKQFTLIQMNMGREVSRRLRELDEELFRINIEGSGNLNDVYRHT